MHLAFIGFCPELRDLALAAADQRHRITWYIPAEQRTLVTDVLGTQVNLQPQEEWESLLDNVNLDGILLAEAGAHEVELRSDQWRRLTQAGSRILLVHPVVPALLVYLEVDMLARDSGAVLLPYWRDAHSSTATELRAHASATDSGSQASRLEQVGFRRFLRDRSPQNVTKWFARDAVLLEYLAGPFSEITAVGTDTSEAAYAALGVHLHGPAEIPVRWEVARAQQEEFGVLAAAGPELELSLTLAEATLLPKTVGNAQGGTESPSAEALAGIMAFSAAIRAGSPPLDEWHRSVRAMELADSIEISLRRGRRIEVHYRQMTEETSYKGLMSAAGCGLLMLGLVILVFAGMLNAVFGWRLTRFWYVPVLVLFVGFLALQILARLLVRRSEVGSPGRPDDRVD